MERVLVAGTSKLSRSSRAAAYLHPAADAVAVDLLSLGAARRWKELFYEGIIQQSSPTTSSTTAGSASSRRSPSTSKSSLHNNAVLLHWAPGSRDLVPTLVEDFLRLDGTEQVPHGSSSAKNQKVFVVADWKPSTFESIAMEAEEGAVEGYATSGSAMAASAAAKRVQWLRSPQPSAYQGAPHQCHEGVLAPIRSNSVDCISAAFGLKSFVTCCGAGQGFEAAIESAARVLKPKGRLHLLDFDRCFEQALHTPVLTMENSPFTNSSRIGEEVVYMRQNSYLSSTLMSYAYYSPIVSSLSLGFAVGRYRGDPGAEDKSVAHLIHVLEECGFRDVSVEALSGGAAKLLSAVKGDSCQMPLVSRRHATWWRQELCEEGGMYSPGMASKAHPRY